MVSESLGAIRSLVAAGGEGVLITPLDGGAPTVLAADMSVLSGPEPSSDLAAIAIEVSATGVPRVAEHDGDARFVEAIVQPPRLMVFGAIAVADALVPMAAAAGFSVTVIDPRPWLATADRYPTATEVRCGDPSEVLKSLRADGATAVVSFLHEPRLEDPVLRWALDGPAGYVGAMGSRRTTTAKRQRLAEAGVPADRIERLRAPIGLDIGGVTPQEIAVAVLAEIVARRREGS